MAIAVTVSSEWWDGKRYHVIGTLAFSGNYVTDGEVASFVGAAGYKSSKDPEFVSIDSKLGYHFKYDKATKKVVIFGYQPADATAGVLAQPQIAAASYPAAIGTGPINFYAIGKR